MSDDNRKSYRIGFYVEVEADGFYSGDAIHAALAATGFPMETQPMVSDPLPCIGEINGKPVEADIIRAHALMVKEVDGVVRIRANLNITTDLSQYDGTEGQDRESYTDDQDRENYTVDPALEEDRPTVDPDRLAVLQQQYGPVIGAELADDEARGEEAAKRLQRAWDQMSDAQREGVMELLDRALDKMVDPTKGSA